MPTRVETPGRRRDAARSRERILGAAERLFAERGYSGVSLQDIGAAAGLSRGTPSYFFGAKEPLYVAVLERAFAARDEATRAAFAPVREWAGDPEGDDAGLRDALRRSAAGYMRFLMEHPSFVRLVVREDLAGGRRLQATPRESSAMSEAFGALAAAGARRGTAPFAVPDAVLVFVSLTYGPLTQRATFLTTLGRDLDDPAVLARHLELVVDQVAHLVARPGASAGG